MKPRIFTTAFSSIYPMYIQKAEKKGRSKEEVDMVTRWLTGYDEQGLQAQIDKGLTWRRSLPKPRRSTPTPQK